MALPTSPEPDTKEKDTITESNTKAQIPYERLLISPTFTLIAGPSGRAFYAHKDLLGSLSPEFRKHTHNDMAEGIHNTMTLSDVSEDTLSRFLEWAYTSSYREVINIPAADGGPEAGEAVAKQAAAKTMPLSLSARLLCHAHLYVFSDRFNIPSLKALAFEKLSCILVDLGYTKDSNNVADLLELLSYSFENLPMTNKGEVLLDYLASYSAWMLYVLRKNSSFWMLTESNAEFAKALLKCTEEAEHPPWEASEKTKENGKDRTGLQSKKELLERVCYNCSFRGTFDIACSACVFRDHEINRCDDILPYHLARRIEGNARSLVLNCSYCSRRGQPRLYCPKCLSTSYHNT